MGVWGTAIFSDDVAADTRDAFTDLAAEGLTPADATERLIAESAEILDDEDDAVVFWLALAATQWKTGRLIDSVRDRAFKIIDSGGDLHRWQENKASERNQRKKHLAKLREQLATPQPKEKKLKHYEKSSTEFKPGDVAVFRFDDQRAVRFCVLHLWSDRGGTYAEICLLELDGGPPFNKTELSLTDTLGPHYTMVSREPQDRITLLRRDIRLPERNLTTMRAWNHLPINGYACTWPNFPSALREVLPKLGWQ